MLFFKKKKLGSRQEVDPEEIFMDSLNLPGHDRASFEGRIERPIQNRVFLWWMAAVGIGVLFIAFRLFHLQVFRGEHFAAVSLENISYTLSVAAPRGVIYDRNGKELAANTASFTLVLRPRDLSSEEFADALKKGTRLVGRTMESVWEDYHDFLDSAGAVPYDRLFDRAAWPEEIILDNDISREILLQVASRPEEFFGMAVEESVRRAYPLGPAASHALGFLGAPSGSEERRSRETYGGGIRRVGKSGIEFSYEEFLRGSPGRKIIEIDSSGKKMRERFLEPAIAGKSAILSIDAELQRRAYDIMERHLRAVGKKAGAIVVSDPQNGSILALVSFPGFDGGVISAGKDRGRIQEMLSDARRPLFNRAISGRYAPGSTVKPMLAVGALEEGIIDPQYRIFDEGFISVPNPYNPDAPSIFRDWSKLGWVDMRRAIAYSANVYFYTIGGGYKEVKGLGIERVMEFMKRFGLGATLGIDLPGEAAGLVPGPEVKKETRPEDPYWRIGDTYITSIGQGDTLATPLQINGMTTVIANGGTLFRPRVVRRIADDEGVLVKDYPPEIIRERLADPASFQVVREGMRMAVLEGSARSLADFPVAVAGKTGTAETGAIGKNHGWFTGFAPLDAPEVAVTVLVEEGTGGSTDAVPIAKEVLWAWLDAKKNWGAGNAQEVY